MPALSTAPVGTPEILIERVSEPSVSVSEELMESGIAESSSPLAGETVKFGASATALTVTRIESLVVAVSPF